MLSESRKTSLVQQSSLNLDALRRSDGDGSKPSGLTSGGHKLTVTDRRLPLEMGSSSQSQKATGPGLQRTMSVLNLTGGNTTTIPTIVQQPIVQQPPKLAHGLKLLFDQRYKTKDREMDSGVRFKDADKGKQVGGYTVVKDKDKGVEPGFLAKKAWMPKDENNMLHNPGHKFYQRAHALLDQKLTADLEKSNIGDHCGPLTNMAEKFVQTKYRDAFVQHTTDGSPSTLKKFLSDPANKEFLSDPANKAIRNQVLDHIKTTSKEVRDDLRKDVMDNEKKFQKMHMLKLDYVETDMTNRLGLCETKVRIPDDKQKRLAHREFTAQTRDSANRGAVREVMANDLMKAMGVHSQKLKLVPTEYSDGHTKLLLDSTFATGPKGGKFSDFDGHLQDGFIIKLGQDGEPLKDKKGHYILDKSINELGRNKILMLQLADIDALGSAGGNKGFADNTFIGIDPGHALEEAHLGRTGDIRSDFSFDQPSWFEKRGYKNFTIFDQQPLSEKMEGVRKLQQMKDDKSDMAIFNDYADKFNGKNLPGMDYSAEINTRMKLYAQRRDDILLNVFSERLAVDKFQFQKGVGPGDARQKELANKTLDILDNLEKLTSKTSDLSPKGKVQLECPRVTERREWHVAQDANGVVTMSFTGKQARNVELDLMKFVNANPELKKAMENGLLGVKRDGNKVSFIIPPESGRAHCLETVAEHFTNEAVMWHKHEYGVDPRRRAVELH